MLDLIYYHIQILQRVLSVVKLLCIQGAGNPVAAINPL